MRGRLAVIALTVIIIIAAALSTDYGYPYSVMNTGDTGAASAFDLLKELGFDVRLCRDPVPGEPSGVLLVIGPEYLDPGDDGLRELLDWVYNGGGLYVYGDWDDFAERLDEATPYELPHVLYGGQTSGSFGKGLVFAGFGPESFTNASIRTGAFRLVNNLWQLRQNTIYFAEYGRSSVPVSSGSGEQLTPFGLLPGWLLYPLIQILIILLVTALFYNRWLGRPDSRPSVKREENEDLYALAALMKRGRLKADAQRLCNEGRSGRRKRYDND